MLDMRTAGIFVFRLATYYFSSSVRFLMNSAFDFTPQEDTHDGTYGCPVLNALQNRIELGRRWQGGATLSEGETVDFDNITFWNKALSDSEVSGLVIPEPTTATLSLLALAGLAARRRRK